MIHACMSTTVQNHETLNQIPIVKMAIDSQQGQGRWQGGDHLCHQKPEFLNPQAKGRKHREFNFIDPNGKKACRYRQHNNERGICASLRPHPPVQLCNSEPSHVTEGGGHSSALPNGRKGMQLSSAQQRKRNMCIPPPPPNCTALHLRTFQCDRGRGAFLRALNHKGFCSHLVTLDLWTTARESGRHVQTIRLQKDQHNSPW